MIPLEVAAQNIGRGVVYQPRVTATAEHGMITSVSEKLIFVHYVTDRSPKGTRPEDLYWPEDAELAEAEALWRGRGLTVAEAKKAAAEAEDAPADLVRPETARKSSTCMRLIATGYETNYPCTLAGDHLPPCKHKGKTAMQLADEDSTVEVIK